MRLLIGDFQVKDALLLKYYNLVKIMIDRFTEVKLDHTSLEEIT